MPVQCTGRCLLLRQLLYHQQTSSPLPPFPPTPLPWLCSGPAAVYYSSGYQRIGEVMGLGALMGLRSLLVWGVVGMAWWKVLGWW